jgi:hypothetical protein
MDTKPHVINLIYEVAKGTVTGHREKRRINLGDQLIFQSAVGPVHVKLYPADVFAATEYKTGQPPLVVKKRAPFQYWCGVQINGKTVGFPDNELYGKSDDTGIPS